MKVILVKIASAVLLAFGLAYLADFALLEFRVLAKRNVFDSVTVRSYYEIEEKNARTEYVFGSSQQETCVKSLFPHRGLQACWYLRRHPEQPIRI
jgi:hypothetical protein